MLLTELFAGAPEIEIEELSSDSRNKMRNAIFFCLNGIKYNGHHFIDEAVSNGAKVIVYSEEIEKKAKAIFIKVKNVDETMYKVASKFYDYPNVGIDKYVITGCYGRSSVAKIINYYLNEVSSCAYIGVLGISYGEKIYTSNNSTLNALENIKRLKDIKSKGIKACTFEANATSILYKKLDVIKPEVFVYLNTSKEASDYRQAGNDYFDYIRRYLYTLENDTVVVLNRDDESYKELANSVENVIYFGNDLSADFRIDYMNVKLDGVEFDLIHNKKRYHVKSNLLGKVNIYNLAAAIACLTIRGHDIEDIIEKLENIDYVEGIYEKVDSNYNVIVDSAYDLVNVKEIFDFAKEVGKGRLIGILAINYSDNENRIEKLVELAEKYLDVIIFTEDESKEADKMSLLKKANAYFKENKAVLVPYRNMAIENGINIMNDNDMLLILGKGNENYLNMGLGKEPYSGDKAYSVKYIKKRKDKEI